MMKIKYVGYMSSCNVNINGIFFSNWSKNEIRELDDVLGKKLLYDNKDFVLVEGTTSEAKKITETKVKDSIKVDMDLNDDGIYDSKDKSLAAKVLATKNI